MLPGKQSRGRESWDCEKYLEPGSFNRPTGSWRARTRMAAPRGKPLDAVRIRRVRLAVALAPAWACSSRASVKAISRSPTRSDFLFLLFRLNEFTWIAHRDQGIAEQEALAAGMQEKARQFLGAEIYANP